MKIEIKNKNNGFRKKNILFLFCTQFKSGFEPQPISSLIQLQVFFCIPLATTD